MKDIGAVAKSDRNQQQGFDFRGIDSVVNAVGPVLRAHGVVMLPEAGTPTMDHYESRNGARMAHVLLPVTFTFYGPAGDSVSCSVIGEASDAGDKVLSKAHSVAWRIALLECFAIPTDDPDPDQFSHERASLSPDPIDWPKLGWAGKDSHDQALAANRDLARSLNEDQQAELKDWLADKGWSLPYSADEMTEWADHLGSFEDEGRPFADD